MPEYNSIVFSKLPSIKTSIFSVMTKMAEDHQAINLAQGFPDFNCDNRLIDLVTNYMKKGYYQYAPMPGIMPIREQIAIKTEELYQTKYNPDTEITITAGATQAIFTAIGAFVREGDEVIVIEPAYDCYVPAIKLHGGNPVFIELQAPEFKYNWEIIKRAINQHTKMIIVNNPMNPVGRVFSSEDIAELEKLTENTDIIILADEVYEHIVFDAKKHLSLAKSDSLAARSIIVSSFGKTYHTTGLKLGYCMAPEKLMREFRKVHQYNVFSVNTTLQYAYADLMKEKDLYLELSAFYQQKRDYFCNLLKETRFKVTPTQGTYFQVVDYSEISDMQDLDFANYLVKDHKVASIPLSPFFHIKSKSPLLRLCFAKNNDTIEMAINKLCKV